MDRAQIITTLTAHKPVLAQRFGVLKLALFGSVAAWRGARGTARGTARADSDVDVLVDFAVPATPE